MTEVGRGPNDLLRIVWRRVRSMFPEGDRDPRVRRSGTLDDLAQEAVLAVLDKQGRGLFRPEKALWSAWVYRTAGWAAMGYTNMQRVIRTPSWGGVEDTEAGRLRQEARERTRRICSLTDKLLARTGVRDGGLEEFTEADHLGWCLDRLADSECELLGLHFVEGWSMRRIARDAGMKHTDVWVLIRDALERLRELYFTGKTTC